MTRIDIGTTHLTSGQGNVFEGLPTCTLPTCDMRPTYSFTTQSIIVNSPPIVPLLKTFTLYRSSAGSGKTRTLAKEYLRWALRNKAHYFRHILAVTFTNKATQEMKDRVLAYLAVFSGKSTRSSADADQLAKELKRDLKLDDNTFRENSSELLSLILHHYDQFSISTIDAFFQRVIRAFTRESGLLGDYRLEVETDTVLQEVVDSVIDELSENRELTDWVVRFAQESMEADKTWDIRQQLVGFAKEIFRDEFKLVEEEVGRHASKPQFFSHLRHELEKIRKDFIASVSKPAIEAWQIIQSKGWDGSYFKYGKNSGLETYLRSFSVIDEIRKLKIKDRMRNDFGSARDWPGTKYPLLAKEIMSVAEKELIPRIQFINKTYDQEYARAVTAELVLQHFYVFGLMADIARKLTDYKRENNLMLLADAPRFLNHIIGDSDTPFVYEKVGSFYRNYLIDEFQDTSGFQWKNFLPLVANSLDQGYPSMVVGDVKQAIYRWRGGDLSLLQRQLEKHVGSDRVAVEELSDNYRSAREIVQFNNLVFDSAANQVAAKLGSPVPAEVYHDVRQSSPPNAAGFVKVDFLTDNEEQTWQEQSLKKLARDLEYLQTHHVAPGDIAILVRRHEEGQRIAASLLEHKRSPEAKKNVRYDVVSNESLRIDGACSVNLLLGALRHLVNPDDPIAKAQLCYEYARLHGLRRPTAEIFSESSKVFFDSQVPGEFTQNKLSLKKLPLFELTETLIGLFNLGKLEGELAYLQAFQDLVLDFYTRERNDLASFIAWWDENKDLEKTSIKLSGEVDAINILTIHKAKGLQFKYVLIPFASWSIDHEGFRSPFLWVTSGEPPYDAAGPMPVKYTSAVAESYFAPAYEEERVKVHLDNLNLLYVALTRAERGMIITAPRKGRDLTTSVASWLDQAIKLQPDLQAVWSEGTGQLSLGELQPQDVKSPLAAASQKLSGYETGRWRDKLVIRQAGNIFFDGMNPDTRESIRYGVYLHALLSKIRTQADTETVIEQLAQEGLIAGSDRVALEAQLRELLAHPLVAKWFDDTWEVRTEVPILLPGGATQRIDRLMLHGKHAVVVDFKTGEQSKANQQQVADYLEVLRQMGYGPVEGYLLYTRDKEVVAVGEGKPHVVKKKKDDKQLGLGF